MSIILVLSILIALSLISIISSIVIYRTMYYSDKLAVWLFIVGCTLLAVANIVSLEL